MGGAGVRVYFEDQRSGIKRRPELERLLDLIEPGDTLVVYKLDRLARSLADLLRIADRLATSGACLRSLTEPIETTTPAGRMIFQLLGVLAEFERSVILERCNAGRAAAIAEGRPLGRQRKFDYEDALAMRQAGKTCREIAGHFTVAHSTVVKALQRMQAGKAKIQDGRPLSGEPFGPGSMASPPSPVRV